MFDKRDGLLVEDDHVAVGEVVLGREGVGWVDPDAGEEGCCAKHGEKPPLPQMLLPYSDAEQEDQRVHGKQVAREKRAAEDGEGDPVGEENDDDCGYGAPEEAWGGFAANGNE